jgi:hypothetical protein
MPDRTINPEHQPGIPSQGEADAIQKFFRRPLFLSVTIGIPFCFFKLLFGIVLIRAGSPSLPLLAAAGWLTVVWAGTDLLMNAGRAVLDFFSRESPFEYCTIAQIGRAFGMPAVFLALDTLIAFTIICLMLWSGLITRLTPPEAYLWYAATTLNLISLSSVLLYAEIRRIR